MENLLSTKSIVSVRIVTLNYWIYSLVIFFQVYKLGSGVNGLSRELFGLIG